MLEHRHGRTHRHVILSYLDKFAVYPSHQGDGTVDILWVALHNESFGCGLAHALKPNEGRKMGFRGGRRPRVAIQDE